LKLNGIYQLLAPAVDLNIVGDKINTINKNTEALIDSSKEVGIEANTQKTKYICMLPRHQNSEQDYNIKIAIRSFENVTRNISEL
jgi:hypothetical protein